MLHTTLLFPALLAASPWSAPQGVPDRVPIPPGTPIRDAGVLDWATGTWRDGVPAGAALPGAAPIYANTCNWTGGAFIAGGAGTCFDWWDDGRIPTTDPNDPTLATAGLSDCFYVVCGWEFLYCTGEAAPQTFFLSFSGGTVSNGVGGQCAGPFAPLGNDGAGQTANVFQISGLPPSAVQGVLSCWLVTVDLSNSPNQFSMNGNDDETWGDGSDHFAWAWRLGTPSLSPNNPTGLAIAGEPSLPPGAGTFDIPAAIDPVTGGPCGNAMDLAGLDNGDLFWINTDGANPCGGPASGCYSFGGWPGNPAGGFYLSLWGIVAFCDGPSRYCEPKPSDALGCLGSVSVSSPFTGPVSGANDYTITVSGIDGLRPGIFIGGINGQASLPFLGGTLCFLPPIERGGIRFSGGTAGQCDGSYSEVLNTGLVFPAGFDAGPGGASWMQAWYRSPCMGCGTGFDIGLSNAFEILNWT